MSNIPKISYTDYPPDTAADIARLRQRIEASGLPPKRTDYNLLVGTWNIRAFSEVHRQWTENSGSPKRNLRALAVIAEVIRRFDVMAIQEVKRDTSGLRLLVEQFLGHHWAVIISDVSGGSGGNTERLGFVYDTRRVQPSGLAGEIVLPPIEDGAPTEQFVRTPYIVGFQAAQERFALLTAHIKYGNMPEARLPELRRLANYIATEIRDRLTEESEERNLMVLGDFNIDKRGDNPLFQAFVSTGLIVPMALRDLKTTFGTEPKYYDQIAWFMGAFDLMSEDRAGVIDFTEAVFPEITPWQMSYRVSDHFPLWVEFIIDRSTEQLARTLGIDPAMPDPLNHIDD